MADKLMQYYALAAKEGGMSAKIKLAQLTKIPSTQAALLPDTPENLALFQEALETILGKSVPAL